MTDEVRNLFIERLLEEIDDQGMSEDKFRETAKISYAMLRNWKNKTSFPSAKVLIRICKLLYISSDYLLGLSDER